MVGGQRIHDLVPHSSPAPANEAVVAGGVRPKVLRQITPRRTRTQNPKDAVKHAPGGIINPPGSVMTDANTLFCFRFRGHSRHGLLLDSFRSKMRRRVQLVTATPLVVYRREFRIPRSSVDVG